jgi:hypothetical protein
MQFWFVRDVLRYFNCSTISKGLLPIFMLNSTQHKTQNYWHQEHHKPKWSWQRYSVGLVIKSTPWSASCDGSKWVGTFIPFTPYNGNRCTRTLRFSQRCCWRFSHCWPSERREVFSQQHSTTSQRNEVPEEVSDKKKVLKVRDDRIYPQASLLSSTS